MTLRSSNLKTFSGLSRKIKVPKEPMRKIVKISSLVIKKTIILTLKMLNSILTIEENLNINRLIK